jgi:hypothetical protein
MTIKPHPTAWAVANRFWTIHRTGHAGSAKRALTTHLAIEHQTFDRFLEHPDRFFKAPVTECFKQRMQLD